MYDITVFRNVINLVDSEKIIFGSDYPLRVYPKKQKTLDMRTFIDDIKLNAGLSKKESDQIFKQNIENLLNL